MKISSIVLNSDMRKPETSWKKIRHKKPRLIFSSAPCDTLRKQWKMTLSCAVCFSFAVGRADSDLETQLSLETACLWKVHWLLLIVWIHVNLEMRVSEEFYLYVHIFTIFPIIKTYFRRKYITVKCKIHFFLLFFIIWFLV